MTSFTEHCPLGILTEFIVIYDDRAAYVSLEVLIALLKVAHAPSYLVVTSAHSMPPRMTSPIALTATKATSTPVKILFAS